MKKLFNQGNKLLFALFLGYCLLFSQRARSGEFVIINQTFTYTMENGNAFSLHAHPDASMPSNWLSPNNYWNGSFYAYYEVISVPTSEPFGFQMGVFQYMPSAANRDGINFYETCSFDIPEITGVGDVVQFNYGSPANWWQHWNGPVDFSKVYDFESVGPVIYSLVPGAKGGLSPTNGGGSDAAWAIRANWFPCTLRVIIVAVSQGSTFSGWSNYLGGCSAPAQPGTISGNASPTQGSSQTYSISDVPDATSYTWTLPSGWSGSSTTSSIDVTVGNNGGTISVKANNSCGSSTARNLAVTVGCGNPVQHSTPTYGIDYGTETTNKTVPSTDEYSYNANMSGAVSGNGQKLLLNPGQDVYFRTKASGDGCFTASAVQPLDVPSRPTMPTFSIDFINEKTNEVIGTEIAYSTSPSYTNPVNGNGTKVTLIPGEDLYLWVKATSTTFASMDYHLVVPNRLPNSPEITIDYANEKTSAISTNQEWSTNSSMASAVSGTNTGVTLTPGNDIYIRTKATVSTFKSDIQPLNVPNKPAGPEYEINYGTEKTSTAVPATVEYSTQSDMSSVSSGTGTAITVTPGTDLYFRTKATGSAFRSTISSLDVPIRPSLVYGGPSTVTEPTITMHADLDASMTGFDLTDLSVTNGTAQNLRSNIWFDVIGAEKGDVKVIIPSNKFDGASFTSNEVVVYYDKASTGLPDYKDEKFILYPNPADNGNIYLKSAGIKASRIDVLSSNGVCLRSFQINKDNAQQISLQDLPKGIYILQIFSDEETCLQKIIIE